MLCLTFIGQVPSHLNAVVNTAKISKALQATRAGPSDGAGTVWSQFARVLVHKGHTELNMFSVFGEPFKSLCSKQSKLNF